MPIRDAISVVNQNNSGLQMTLKSKGGFARCQFTDPDGKKRKFDVDADLIVLCPRNMRLNMSVLGKSYFAFGSNQERYWVEQPDARALTWGRHDRDIQPLARELIIRPELIVQALGISLLPEDLADANGPVQRLTDDYQQLIFVDHSGQAGGGQAGGRISKEFWLDRYSPQLIGRIVFRDPMGQIAMDAKLGNYKPIIPGGPLIPHRFEIDWPATEGHMLFTTRGWKMLPQVTEEHPAFQFPLDRGARFDHIVDLDVELDHMRNPPDANEEIRRQLEEEQWRLETGQPAYSDGDAYNEDTYDKDPANDP